MLGQRQWTVAARRRTTMRFRVMPRVVATLDMGADTVNLARNYATCIANINHCNEPWQGCVHCAAWSWSWSWRGAADDRPPTLVPVTPPVSSSDPPMVPTQSS